MKRGRMINKKEELKIDTISFEINLIDGSKIVGENARIIEIKQEGDIYWKEIDVGVCFLDTNEE